MNRLANEASPYLRQHADNPVDWYPWGQEAFVAAREADRPILLSVGYSACHWCHVMAHESFEDTATAAVMNSLFVNVKVDREERPDVDAIYMDAVQATTGRGGWPMTVFLTPDGHPFFAATYLPKRPQHGMASFTAVMERIGELWQSERDRIEQQSHQLTAALNQAAGLGPGDLPDTDVLATAADKLSEAYDPEWGGFGEAPKFPQSMSLDLLLRHHSATGDDRSLDLVANSLLAMASGGMYDHLGGGFARYSVDREWLVPHFEKMLYDNALLSGLYLRAWKATGDARFAQVAAETIEYVLRDLGDARGGFYSAEDADSEGIEGKFYVWTIDELRDVLGTDADAAIDWYGVADAGNFSTPEGPPARANILHRPIRGDLIRPPGIDRSRAALFDERATRVRPGLDDKVLTEWNALMLTSLCEAAGAMGNDRWTAAAVANGEFLLAHLRNGSGRWHRAWQPDTGARHLALSTDYAALVDAFIALAALTGKAHWVDEARTTAEALLDLFWDPTNGGVFTTGSDAETLITRPKEVTDNATPSGNSLTAGALLRLAALTGESRYGERAEEALRLVGAVAAEHPTAFGHALAGLDMHRRGLTEIVITGERPDLVAAVKQRYLPNAVMAWGEPFDSPLWQGRDGAQAYVCRNYTCSAPVTTAIELAALLD